MLHRAPENTGAHPARKLGANERSFWKLSEASPLNVGVIAHLGTRLDPERVRDALRGLQLRHPLLRARIELRDGEPHFVWPASVPAPELVEVDVPRADWQPLAETSMRQVIPWDRAPMLHAQLMNHEQGCTLILYFHHAIVDGGACFPALRDVLWQATTGMPVSTRVYSRSVAAESALPKAARGVGGALRRARAVAKFSVDSARYRDVVKFPALQDAAPHERTYHAELRPLAAETSKRLLERTRKEGSTMHGAIAAAMLMGVTRAAGITGERSVGFGSPVNVRSMLSPPVGEQMGLYLGAAPYSGRVSPDSRFWDIARDVRKNIADGIRAGTVLASLPLMGLVYESFGGNSASVEEFGRKWAASNGTTGVTNVGRIDVEPPPGVEVERVHVFGFPSGLDIFNAIASSYAGSLQLTFNWPEPCLDEAHTRVLCDDIVGRLVASIDGDPRLGSPV